MPQQIWECIVYKRTKDIYKQEYIFINIDDEEYNIDF